MSYYQGDYYQGDYYQGDPFLGALIGMGATWLGKKLLGKGASKALVASTGAGAMVGAGSGIVAGAVGTEWGDPAFWPGAGQPVPPTVTPPAWSTDPDAHPDWSRRGSSMLPFGVSPEQNDNEVRPRAGDDVRSK